LSGLFSRRSSSGESLLSVAVEPIACHPMLRSMYLCRSSSTLRGLDRVSLSSGATLRTHRTERWARCGGVETAAVAKRLITSRAARQLLGLPGEPHRSFTVVELRDSYFRAAKMCHPDVIQSGDNDASRSSASSQGSSSASSNSSHDFIRITQAYELLQQEASSATTNFALTPSEEEEFRLACEQNLGLSAEIVEECKQNPGFLRWLSGWTDSAHHWRSFFSQHGGLGPRLKPRHHLPGGGSDVGAANEGVENGPVGPGVNRRAKLVRR
jgi:hypothetical protein